MSDDKNSNDIEEVVETVKETVGDAVETVQETVEDVVETVQDAVEDAVDEGGNAVSKIMELKDSNPKVFFGAIAGLIIVILFMFMGGGSNNPIPKPRQVNLSIGNTYTLQGVNTTSSDATVRLVAVPGSMAAYDENEEGGTGTGNDCKHMPQGTQVKLLQMQDAFGGATFVELEILGSAKCTGRKGWASSSNLK